MQGLRLEGSGVTEGNNKDIEVTEEWVKSSYRRSQASSTFSQPVPL